MSSDALALRVAGLGKQYMLGAGAIGYRDSSLAEEAVNLIRRGLRRDAVTRSHAWALRDVSFDINAGERVGVIGRNGAGKSTLLKILARITAPTEGRAEIHGRVGALLEVGAGFHRELTGRENVFLSGVILGMGRREVQAKLDDIVEFAGVGEFLDTPIKRYSSGMYLRLAFAVAAHLEPDVLLVDEVLAVGDADFQKKCLTRMEAFGSSGRTVLFVSHNMPAILRFCDRVIVLDGGKVVADGPPGPSVRAYLDSGGGTTAERLWPDAGNAPGDEWARLRAVRVCQPDHVVNDQIDLERPFVIEAEYAHLADDAGFRPRVTFQLYNENGTLLFGTADLVNHEWQHSVRRPGLVTARCRVPANLLAEGQVFITAHLTSDRPDVRSHAAVPDAVGIRVVDGMSGYGARGDWRGDWPGAVRPLLQWEIETAPLPATELSGRSLDDRPPPAATPR